MISKVVLAKLSPTMEEGVIVKWNKAEGDAVKVGDVLAEIETDKANMEMEALAAGVLRRILTPAGESAPVGTLIGVIAGPDEDISALVDSAAKAAPAKQPAAAPSPATPKQPTRAPAAPAPAPAAVAAPAPGGRVKSSPLARRMAAERSIAIGQVPGSGPGGRVIRRDIEAWSGAPAAGAAAPVASHEIPLSGMRRTIARRLSESMFSAPHFYLSVEVAMDAAVALREQLKQAEAKVSYNDMVVKACAKALRAFPGVNASWGEDRILSHGQVNVGIAVALDDGLITPVVRDADRRSVSEIAAQIRDLAGRARDKKLKPDEYTGSTFTVSNLGMFDVASFTAIINPPDSAILAVGSVRREPVVDGDAIRVGHRMSLTLSSDHRVIDGALAARFMAEVRRLLEAPLLLLL